LPPAEASAREKQQYPINSITYNDADQGSAKETSCGFGYESAFSNSPPLPEGVSGRNDDRTEPTTEPPPPYTYRLAGWRDHHPEDLVMPGYKDTMPLFERADGWSTPTRCFETPAGVRHLNESQAFELYRTIAESTTGLTMNTSPEVRTIVGLRGAYPGQLIYHGNLPDRFNDTLVLLWTTKEGFRHVREFPVTTDPGLFDFGRHHASFLRANRRYRLRNGLHNSYHALRMAEKSYVVRDDTNHNGHWDNDRNGWLSPRKLRDHDRQGSAHNIHMAEIDGPLGHASIGIWSAGCQVIPGIANWRALITQAFTKTRDRVDYFLIDSRDIPASVWRPCTADGTPECPFRIDTLPYTSQGDTSQSGVQAWETYSGSDKAYSGREITYALTVDRRGKLTIRLDYQPPVRLAVHVLEGSDPKACVAWGDKAVIRDIEPGRYFLVVDTPSQTAPPAGAFTIHVSLN